MNTKSTSVFIGVCIVAVVGVFVYWQSASKTVYTAPVVQNTETVSSATYTMAEVSVHADGASCWSVIDAHVYDLTTWISQHPGGEAAIVSLCGVDGTVAFHGQHGDRKKQADILANYKIAELAQ